MPSYQEMPDLGWEPEVLETKAKAIRRNAFLALGASLVGLIFFGILLGAYAIYAARDALTDINVYNVNRDYRWVARIAQVLGCLDIIFSILNIILRLTRH
jgi:hypothetical protein